MTEMSFQWDKKKDQANFKKHVIHFSEASTVFYDENAREYSDPDHSENEARFLMLGMSRSFRVLIVSYCYRESDNFIRKSGQQRNTKLFQIRQIVYSLEFYESRLPET